MSMHNQLDNLSEAIVSLGNGEARGRLERLFDEGTFVELDRLACAEVVTGFGMVDGAPVYAFAQDRNVCSGAVGRTQGDKIRRVYELAAQNGAPVVALFDSDGALLGEGLDAMDAIAEILLASNNLSGVVPQIAVVAGACVGSPAMIAANADLTIYVEGADYYLRGDDASAAPAVTVADISAALDTVRNLLSLLPSNNLTAAVAYDFDSAAMPDCAEIGGVLNAVADAGSLIRLYEGSCETALARVGGTACGLITLAGDEIDCADASKVARFVRFCDGFSLPLLTFVDAAGFRCLKGAAKVSHAYAEATTAKATVIVGRAFGSVYIAAAGKSAGADVVLAWPSAVISPLTPETAVHILWKDRLAGMENPTADRVRLAEEYARTEASPLAAAKGGFVTDVITPDETRARLIALLEILAGKRVSRLPKKHSNIQL